MLTNTNSLEICLHEIETRIPRETLILFESCLSESTWHGQIVDTTLCNLWKAICQEIAHNKGDVSQNNTKENNADRFVETNNNNEEQKTTSLTAALENYNNENKTLPPTKDNIVEESGQRTNPKFTNSFEKCANTI